MMIKRTHIACMAASVAAACLLVPLAGSAAGPPDVVCPQYPLTFSGTARELTVPAGGLCLATGATVTHDLVLGDGALAGIIGTSVTHDLVLGEDVGVDVETTMIGHDVLVSGNASGGDFTDSSVGHDFVAGGDDADATMLRTAIGHDVLLLGQGGELHLESVTIAHDLYASRPQTIQTGHNSPSTPGGPVNIGHDLVIQGSPDNPFVFDGFCGLNVGNDMRITDRTVNLGIGVGPNCAGRGLPTNTIGRDLTLTGDSSVSGALGPSSISVVDNHVGRNLVFSGNTAASGGALEVSANTVVGDATCSANSPAVTVNVPNTAGGANTCG
jgi:predicted outer membrane repeat protein